MAGKWEVVKFSDFVSFVSKKKKAENAEFGTYISTENMLPEFGGITKAATLPNNGGVTQFQSSDILFSNIRTYFKKVWQAKFDGLCSNDVLVFRSKNPRQLSPDYLYHICKWNKFTEFSIRTSQGAKMPRGDKAALAGFEFSLPPLSEQRAIAHILGTLDDKIELNRQMNETLEAMARALFKSWFVDFEPWNGVMPARWKRHPLGDLVCCIDNRGKTPPLAPYITDYPIIDVKALSGDQRIVDYSKCTKYVNENTYYSWFRSGHPQPYDILLSTVGSLAEIKLFLGVQGCIAQNVVSFRPKEKLSLYLFQYLRFIKNDLIAYNIGSVQPSIKLTHIVKHLILVPEEKVLVKFDNFLDLITKRIYCNCMQNEMLNAIRNTLLPKLISGQLRIKDAEQFLESHL